MKLDFNDPNIISTQSKVAVGSYDNGYLIYPSKKDIDKNSIIVLCIGNSTTLQPTAAGWSFTLVDILRDNGIHAILYNGAGKGNTSSQELIRIIRDVPSIKPRVIISLSGITDIGFLNYKPKFPFFHRYFEKYLNAVDPSIKDKIVLGIEDPCSPAEIWCRNQRFAHLIAQEVGSYYLCLLQPTMAVGKYNLNESENLFYDTKKEVVLKDCGLKYENAVKQFYNEVEAIIDSDYRYDFIINFKDVFADCDNAYRDHRHYSQRGEHHLAKEIFSLLKQRKIIDTENDHGKH